MQLLLGPPGLMTEFNFTIKTLEQPHLTAGRLGYFDKIGIDMSGGIDSVALLCLVISELKLTSSIHDYKILCFTVKKDDGATYYSARIVQKVSEFFGVDIEHINNEVNDLLNVPDAPRHVTNIDSIVRLHNRYSNLITYCGINKVPHSSVKEFEHSSETRSSQNYDYVTTDSGIICPLLNLHKPQILDIYYKLGCEDLLKWTHSCVENLIGTCNACYSCEERAWGFSSLVKDDPGTIVPNISDISFNGTWINPYNNNIGSVVESGLWQQS